MKKTISLAMTGASGMPYGFRLLECLLQAEQTVYFMLSPAARTVISLETDLKLPADTQKVQEYLSERYQASEGQLTVFTDKQWTAPVASGSAVPDAMVVCPCSSGCVSAIATGASENLIERAADVVIKEQRKLILVHRETPLSAIHLENLLKLARLGVTILPANPGFYNNPLNINELVDFVVARILDHLGISHNLQVPWGTKIV
jgi:4-hydroxy-3-polyprenylbenzoate decarboxylase